MEHFLFSINVTMPIFLVMVIGWLLKKKETDSHPFLSRIGILDEHFVRVANSFNFKVTLPFMVFRDLSSVDIRSAFDMRFVLFCAVSTSICFWGIWGCVKLFLKDLSLRGAFVQAAFRSSAAVMGLAFISNIYGASAMGPMMIIGAVPLYNIYSVLVLTFESRTQNGNRAGIREACVNIVKNPIIISIFLGVLAALLELDFPQIVDKTIQSIAQLATPLALIGLGAGFEGRRALAKLKPTLWASAVKLVIQPLIFLPAAAWLGFSGEKMVAILIMLAAPATPSCYIMAKNMGNDGVLTASIVVMTTLLAAVTLTAWICLLRMAGLI